MAPITKLMGLKKPLPCPFCGGSAQLEKKLREGCKEGEPEAFAFFYTCLCCASVGGWAKTEAGALRCWNIRTTNE